jgi:hypothetical protein
MTVEFSDLFLVNTYVPNSGQKLERYCLVADAVGPAALPLTRTVPHHAQTRLPHREMGRRDADLPAGAAENQASRVDRGLECNPGEARRGAHSHPARARWQVAHKEIDIHDPKGNVRAARCLLCRASRRMGLLSQRKSAGFTDQERANFDKVVAAGFIDSYRCSFAPPWRPNPAAPDICSPKRRTATRTGATALAASRKTKVRLDRTAGAPHAPGRVTGWRLDYFMVTPSLKERVKVCKIHKTVRMSDHAPLEFVLSP